MRETQPERHLAAKSRSRTPGVPHGRGAVTVCFLVGPVDVWSRRVYQFVRAISPRPRTGAQLDVSYVYGVSPVEFCPSLRSPRDLSARHYKSVLFIYNKYSWPPHEIFMYIPRAIQFVRVTTLLFESPPCIYNIVNGDYLSGCFTYFHTK